MIHRDVKPANILLERGIERILITDFGLARTVDDASLTHTGIVADTTHYMSPEQANGDTVDHRTDLFSLGSFMATGRPPFRAERAMGVLHRICHHTHCPAWQVNCDISDDLSDIIDRLLQKKAPRRFANAVDVRESLARVLARTQQHGIRRRRWAAGFIRRNPVLASGTMVCLVFAVVALFAFVLPGIELGENRSASPESGVLSGSDHSLAWQRETLAADAAAYSAASQGLWDRLGQLEATSNAARFSQPTSDEFWQDAESYSARLHQLEADTFRDSSTSSTKE